MRNAWDALRSGGHSTIVVRISTPSDDAQQEVVAVASAEATTPRLDH